jgi:aminoglycoside/choline kinase family phosphotransferase
LLSTQIGITYNRSLLVDLSLTLKLLNNYSLIVFIQLLKSKKQVNQSIQASLRQLFESAIGEAVHTFEILPASGSDRRYCRMISQQHTVIGAYNSNLPENKAFLSFTKQFLSQGIAVPKIYAEDLPKGIYLLEDLGNETLFDFLNKSYSGKTFPAALLQMYKKVVRDLATLQIKGHKNMDYSVCYQSESFDKKAMIRDLNTFKYYFLQIVNADFNPDKLDKDFNRFANYLVKEKSYEYFMFRDFQARNIMIKDNVPYYIDYQSGRKGALQYDLASLLYQAKASIPQDVREELTNDYIEAVGEQIDMDAELFRAYFYAYVMLRSVQVLGIYGLRGLFQRKEHFLTSIPYALTNIKWLLDNDYFPKGMPEFKAVLRQITQMESLRQLNDIYPNRPTNLTVTISSFSYKRAIPEDTSDNGGGFVFDCRSIHNPGRYEPYKKLTGRDKPVQDFLKTNSEIPEFLENVYALVDRAVKVYIDRDFSHLMVSFGCTGGQHRSVFSADSLAAHLAKKFNVTIKVHHIEQELKNWVN